MAPPFVAHIIAWVQSVLFIMTEIIIRPKRKAIAICLPERYSKTASNRAAVNELENPTPLIQPNGFKR